MGTVRFLTRKLEFFSCSMLPPNSWGDFLCIKVTPHSQPSRPIALRCFTSWRTDDEANIPALHASILLHKKTSFTISLVSRPITLRRFTSWRPDDGANVRVLHAPIQQEGASVLSLRLRWVCFCSKVVPPRVGDQRLWNNNVVSISLG